jgi:hypothetical protein
MIKSRVSVSLAGLTVDVIRDNGRMASRMGRGLIGIRRG